MATTQGDISDVFKGTAQFQPAPQNVTYYPSTGKTIVGTAAPAYDAYAKSTGFAPTPTAQQQANLQAVPISPVEAAKARKMQLAEAVRTGDQATVQKISNINEAARNG